jgi:hypothetical protein
MSTEPTPLAQRLLDAARPHVWAVDCAATVRNVEALVGAVVVAVLRELATDTAYMRRDGDGDWLSLARIRSLADSIERGEG